MKNSITWCALSTSSSFAKNLWLKCTDREWKVHWSCSAFEFPVFSFLSFSLFDFFLFMASLDYLQHYLTHTHYTVLDLRGVWIARDAHSETSPLLDLYDVQLLSRWVSSYLPGWVALTGPGLVRWWQISRSPQNRYTYWMRMTVYCVDTFSHKCMCELHKTCQRIWSPPSTSC